MNESLWSLQFGPDRSLIRRQLRSLHPSVLRAPDRHPKDRTAFLLNRFVEEASLGQMCLLFKGSHQVLLTGHGQEEEVQSSAPEGALIEGTCRDTVGRGRGHSTTHVLNVLLWRENPFQWLSSVLFSSLYSSRYAGVGNDDCIEDSDGEHQEGNALCHGQRSLINPRHPQG